MPRVDPAYCLFFVEHCRFGRCHRGHAGSNTFAGAIDMRGSDSRWPVQHHCQRGVVCHSSARPLNCKPAFALPGATCVVSRCPGRSADGDVTATLPGRSGLRDLSRESACAVLGILRPQQQRDSAREVRGAEKSASLRRLAGARLSLELLAGWRSVGLRCRRRRDHP